jgi:subtilisin family serine protease
MRPHLLLKLRRAPEIEPLAHWADIIESKSRASERLVPEIDSILNHHRVPVWVTQEHRPNAGRWTEEEVRAGLDRIYRLILQNDGEVPPALVRDISLLPQVEYVRLGAIGTADMPRPVAAQLSRDYDGAREAIHLDEAHAYTQGDPSITVAVLDTGVDEHPEYRGVMLPGHDFVDIIDGAEKFIGDHLGYDEDPDDLVGHGTHVAGIIAAQGRGMPRGVVPRCKILPVRVLGAMQRGDKRIGAGLVDNINVGIKWAIDQGADVINMSLGIRNTGGGLPHEEVVDYAKEKGVTIVAASGNDGSEELYYPGALPHVICVGAVDESGEVAAFSTFGKQVTLVAPGTEIYSTYLDGEYAFSSGTSHASPFVAGAVAMLRSFARKKGARLTDKQAKYLLKHTADKVDRSFKHPKAGFGRLNLIDALRLLEYRLN